MNKQTVEVSDNIENAIMPSENEQIIMLLKEQNEILQKFKDNISSCMINDHGEYLIRSDIVDFDIPISTMIGLMFKWLVASIPIGIICVVVYLMLTVIF